MKTREEVVIAIEDLMEGEDDLELMWRSKHHKSHFGKQELKILMDFIYEEEPQNVDQKLTIKGSR